MHNITPKQSHIIIPVNLAMHGSVKSHDEATDGLNETFNTMIKDGFLADYQFNLKELLVVMSDNKPEEGDLFHSQAINRVIYPDSLKDTNTKIVWVVASESLNSGSFDWYHNKHDAIEAFERDKKHVPIGHTQCVMFGYEVDDKLSNEEVTTEIDGFYHEMSLNETFNQSQLVQGYPFTANAWLDIAKEWIEAEKQNS